MFVNISSIVQYESRTIKYSAEQSRQLFLFYGEASLKKGKTHKNATVMEFFLRKVTGEVTFDSYLQPEIFFFLVGKNKLMFFSVSKNKLLVNKETLGKSGSKCRCFWCFSGIFTTSF